MTLTLDLNPWLDPSEIPDGMITWSDTQNWGMTVPGDQTKYLIPRSQAGATTVTANVLGHTSDPVQIVVCKLASLTSDACDTTDANGDNAVAPVDPQNDRYVTLTAHIDEGGSTLDLSPVYNQLIKWTGGQPGDTPDTRKVSRKSPVKTPVKAQVGVSNDSRTVWVVKVSLGISGVPDSQKATQDAKIKINTDDDDCDGVPDKDDTGTVVGEDDLIPLTLTVEPAGVGGTLTLTANTQSPDGTITGSKLGMYLNGDKSGGPLTKTTWDLSTRLDNDPSNDDNPPTTIYLEGRDVSSATGDQKLMLSYNWCITMNDNVVATVVPLPGDSDASLKVFTVAKDGQGNDILGTEKYDPIGGKVFVVLDVTVGAGMRVDPSVNYMNVGVTEDCSLHTPPAQSDLITFDLADASGWQKKVDPCNAASTWVDLAPGETPKSDNQLATPVIYRAKTYWQTTTTPLGHNAPHIVSVSSINGDPNTTEIAFQRYDVTNGWQPAYVSGPKPKTVNVKNLVITGVKTNVNEDYFIYDPDSVDPAKQQPQFQFTIEDAGDPHQYRWVIYIEPTSRPSEPHPTEPLASLAYLSGTSDIPGLVSVSWNGQQNNNTGPLMERGTYTFDIYVDEVENAADPNSFPLDRMEFKTPYCLSVSSHSFEFRLDAGGEETAYGSYTLADSLSQNATSVTIDVLDPDFNIKSSKPGSGVAVNTTYENIQLYTLTDDDPSGEWRAVFMALDEHSDRARDHLPRRMMAVNYKKVRGMVGVFVDKNGGADQTLGTDLDYIAQAFKSAGIKAELWPTTGMTSDHLPAPNQIQWAKDKGYIKVAVLYESTETISSVWPEITDMPPDGSPDHPRRSRWSQDSIAEDGRFADHEQITAANVCLHELSHAFNCVGHDEGPTPPSPYCVMYWRLWDDLAHDLSAQGHYGGKPHTTHAKTHINPMREFVGLKTW